MAGFVSDRWTSLEAKRSHTARLSLRILLGFGFLAFWILVFYGIEKKTVLSYGI